MESRKGAKVLLVDDEVNVLNAYRRNLRLDYEIFVAQGGEQGLSMLKNHGPFAVVVSDFKMPGIDGVTFLKKVKEISKDTVRIMLTGFADLNITMDAVNEGHIFRFLTKPCPVEKLKKTIDEGIRQYELVRVEKELLNKTLRGSVKALIDILSVVNPLVFNLSSRLSKYSVKIAKRLQRNNLWEIEIAALVSQIGLVSVPNDIIEKKLHGFEISESESEMFYSHPKLGAKLLRNIPRLDYVAESVYYQYVDYKHSLSEYKKSGTEIPFAGRILKTLNDFFELNAKEYNESIALREMEKYVGVKYDEKIFGALVAEVEGIEDKKLVVLKTIPELKEGDILVENLKDSNGFLLLPKGTELNLATLSKIINYNKLTKLVEPVSVVES